MCQGCSYEYNRYASRMLCESTGDCQSISSSFICKTYRKSIKRKKVSLDLWENCWQKSQNVCFYMYTYTIHTHTVYPKKYAHGFCFAVLCCGYTLTDFPISIRLTALALWQSNDCPSASKATLMNMDKYFMWIHYERLHNHNKAKHNKTVCIFLGMYCMFSTILNQ